MQPRRLNDNKTFQLNFLNKHILTNPPNWISLRLHVFGSTDGLFNCISGLHSYISYAV